MEPECDQPKVVTAYRRNFACRYQGNVIEYTLTWSMTGTISVTCDPEEEGKELFHLFIGELAMMAGYTYILPIPTTTCLMRGMELYLCAYLVWKTGDVMKAEEYRTNITMEHNNPLQKYRLLTSLLMELFPV